MSCMDFGDVRKGRGPRAKDMRTQVDGNQAAHDAAREVQSGKKKKNKVKDLKGKGTAKQDLSPSDIRKLESIARKREKGQKPSSAEAAFLRGKGFKVPDEK